MTTLELRKRRSAAVVAAVCVGAIAMDGAAMAGSTDSTPTVTVLNIVSTGGGPPAMSRIGQTSVINGEVEDTAGKVIGSWLWRCKYIGGNGTGTRTSHFCQFTVKLPGGSITAEGGYGAWSNATRWQAIIGGTGEYRGVTGVQELYDLNTPRTPDTYYLIKQ